MDSTLVTSPCTRPAASQPAARHCPSTQGHHQLCLSLTVVGGVISLLCPCVCCCCCHSRKDMEDAIKEKHKSSIKDREVRHRFVFRENPATGSRQLNAEAAASRLCSAQRVLLLACRSVSRRPSPRARSHQVGDPQTACTAHGMAGVASSDWKACPHERVPASHGVLAGSMNSLLFPACRWPPEGPLQGRRWPGWRPVWWRLRRQGWLRKVGGWQQCAAAHIGVMAANVDDLLLPCAGATAADTAQTGATSAATAAAMSAVGESQSLLPVKQFVLLGVSPAYCRCTVGVCWCS